MWELSQNRGTLSMTVPPLQVVTEALGGSPLARAALAGEAGEWYGHRPSGVAEWREHIMSVRGVGGSWLEQLAPAFAASGAAAARLLHAATSGVVVTTGQQPGLFGGPMYTLSKALSALALADVLQTETGIPVAPVFWAATDDADFAEASSVWLRLAGGARRVSHDQLPTEGIPLADVPLEGCEAALAMLEESCGSAADPTVLAAVRAAYTPGATIGGAYLQLMRTLLEPMGIAVLDASHPAVLAAGRPVMETALRRASDVNQELTAREAALTVRGFSAQVTAMPELSLVFGRVQGRKVRIPVSEALAVAAQGGVWSPNVLLRPLVERAILPTAGYLAGPGEVAYFAQVSAVADAIGAPRPRVLPRWSGTVLEPAVLDLLARRGIAWRDLEAPHGAEAQIAAAATDPRILAQLDAWRGGIAKHGAELQALLGLQPDVLDARVVDGSVRAMQWRADRLQRRILAGAKRREAGAMHDVETLRGALFPGGKRQERALSFAPMMAQHGPVVVAAMREAATRHAMALVQGEAIPRDP